MSPASLGRAPCSASSCRAGRRPASATSTSPPARIDWARVECLVGDERCVPADDADANQHMIREALIDRVRPRPGFVPMDCEAGAEAYEAVIGASPTLDLVHLGLGPDGHTASLFPGSAGLERSRPSASSSATSTPPGATPTSGFP